MTRVLLVCSSILLLAVSVCFAQQPSSDVSPATKEDILRLFESMQVKQQMRSVMDAMMKQQTALVHETIRKRYPAASEEKIATFDNMMQESMRNFPVDALLDDMIPVYAKHLTHTDVEAMSTFYSSPTGQKLLREMPEMTSESMQVAYARMEKQMDTLMRKAEQLSEEGQPARKSVKPRSSPPQN
jgi:uncharacterized protein